jgi:formylglycine-generating enzyme required for sulfatase activity
VFFCISGKNSGLIRFGKADDRRASFSGVMQASRPRHLARFNSRATCGRITPEIFLIRVHTCPGGNASARVRAQFLTGVILMARFFITHSWKDIEFAKRLCNDLRAHGLEGFFDAYSIQLGDNVPSRIARGLEDCDVYLPLLSPAALASKWSELEISAAIVLNRDHARNERPRIISVVAEKCTVPVLLRTFLYVDFVGRYDDALRDLLNAFGVQVITNPNPQIPIPPPRKIQTPPHSFIHPKTGKEMILIPPGEFVMGSNKGRDNEKPPHKVYLDGFYISRYPVTNAEYKKYVDATKHPPPEHWSNGQIPAGEENHPVTNVTWYDANAYAEWAGARLPTEAEWEKVASWDDAKKVKRVYPWGDTFDANKCNSSESKIGDTTPVGKYSPHGDSPYGIADMAGNVWEWCADWYDENYYRNAPARDPKNETAGSFRVLRGGAFNLVSNLVRAASRVRLNAYDWYDLIGFRLVAGAS